MHIEWPIHSLGCFISIYTLTGGIIVSDGLVKKIVEGSLIKHRLESLEVFLLEL